MEQNRFNCAAFPLQHITNIKKVGAFAKYLVKDIGLSFHPDESFEEYINVETKEPSFTTEECATANALMEECFGVCERGDVDIYETMGNVHNDLVFGFKRG